MGGLYTEAAAAAAARGEKGKSVHFRSVARLPPDCPSNNSAQTLVVFPQNLPYHCGSVTLLEPIELSQIIMKSRASGISL